MKLTAYQARMIEIYRMQERNDLENYVKDHALLLNTLIFLNEALADSKKEFLLWETYADPLMSKFIIHTTTLGMLLSGISINISTLKEPEKSQKILDIPSMHVIQRSQLETFLMYHHIYVNSQDRDEQYLRYCVWAYMGLAGRKNMDLSARVPQELLDANEIDMAQLKDEIHKNPKFKSLSEKQQKQILNKNNERMFKSWGDLLEDAGFTKDQLIHKDLYHSLSTYAHSFALSAMQIKHAKYGYSPNNKECCLICLYSMLLIARLIHSIKAKHKIIEVQYNALSANTINTVKSYYEISQASISKK